MIKHISLISSGAILAISFTGLSGCSAISGAGKSVRNMTSFSQQSSTNNVTVNEKLIIPPSLKTPASASRAPARSVRTNQRRTVATRNTVSSKNYYVVVGTYTSQPQAFDTFVRLSSIGLPGATMESRKAKSGQLLHMVRLGPYQKQESIDKVTNSLTSDGLTQFKIVEN
jgi:cell division protein FtsN